MLRIVSSFLRAIPIQLRMFGANLLIGLEKGVLSW
jgi:hypothetical protein